MPLCELDLQQKVNLDLWNPSSWSIALHWNLLMVTKKLYGLKNMSNYHRILLLLKGKLVRSSVYWEGRTNKVYFILILLYRSGSTNLSCAYTSVRCRSIMKSTSPHFTFEGRICRLSKVTRLLHLYYAQV